MLRVCALLAVRDMAGLVERKEICGEEARLCRIHEWLVGLLGEIRIQITEALDL